MFHRNRMWRAPEMSAEEKVAVFGERTTLPGLPPVLSSAVGVVRRPTAVTHRGVLIPETNGGAPHAATTPSKTVHRPAD